MLSQAPTALLIKQNPTAMIPPSPLFAPLPEPALIAREFARALIASDTTSLGESALEHADAVCSILSNYGADAQLLSSIPLSLCRKHLNKPDDALARFGLPVAELSGHVAHLLELAPSQSHAGAGSSVKTQTERARKMLLAFSRDLRAIMALLASRLQDLRFLTSHKLPAPDGFARDSLDIHSSLAQRLGISGIKWEMEDLSFRLLEPDTYKDIAQRLHAKRSEREADIVQIQLVISSALGNANIPAEVAGRPKHIHSIVKKMRGKHLSFEQVLDIRALRVVVNDIPSCYAALDVVHRLYVPDIDSFDDYIAKPKPNGYQSLHTIARDERGSPMEIQIRTRAMHDLAEHGVAAHWAYKEAGAKGYAGAVSATSSYDAKISALRQLIDWERGIQALPASAESAHKSSHATPARLDSAPLDDAIYVFTPQATLVELRSGATPIDFAYAVHTNLGHRCRGARVDGVMVSLNTPLKSGQTIDIVAAKEGGPSRDWLNPELGYIASPRSRAKIRAWLNAADMAQTVAKGRASIEKIMAREGKTSMSHEELAKLLGFSSSDALFESAGKESISPRSVETALRPPPVDAPLSAQLSPRAAPVALSGKRAQDAVLVSGMDSLMTSLAGCCKPAPPDAICGFISRIKGASIHRANCPNLRNLSMRHPERLIPVEWGAQLLARPRYPVNIHIVAGDRQGLLRDIGEACAKEKTNVVGTQTRSAHGLAHMTFTVEVGSAENLAAVIARIAAVPDVDSAQRK